MALGVLPVVKVIGLSGQKSSWVNQGSVFKRLQEYEKIMRLRGSGFRSVRWVKDSGFNSFCCRVLVGDLLDKEIPLAQSGTVGEAFAVCFRNQT